MKMLDDKDIKNKNGTLNGPLDLPEYWLNLEKAISTISSRFLGNFKIDEAINATLRDIGILSLVSRSYIFLISDDNKYISNTYEWNEEDISPRVHKLQNLELSRFPWLINQLINGNFIHIPNTNALPEDAFSLKEFFELQNIKSVLNLPAQKIVYNELSGSSQGVGKSTNKR